MVACNSHVLLTEGENTLYVFDVSAGHNLRDAGSLPQQTAIKALACACSDDETLVAFAKADSVSLHRLTSGPLRLEPLATSVNLKYPDRLLFCGELLLVADRNRATTGSHAIVSFRATGNALTERRVLLDDQDSVVVRD